MERVKGIEPSYSAWKAAALPLSYTRAQAMNYHVADVASTAMRRFGPVPEASIARRQPLNRRRFAAYTKVSTNNERR